ncbi:MAG: ABC transporter ATP-binding protein, partial [Clostridia bacterium]|nr:ABC transporter ATP-binding protein [Clostridia bacterium]
LIVWGLGGAQVLGGRLSFGELMTYVGYLSLLYAPVNFMVKTFDWWTNCMNSAQRIFEITDRKTDVPEGENPVELKNIKGEIELKNVTFAYEPNRNVLKNVSFKISPGEMVGLVGRSGAGKSTITNIITRLYDVNEGEVLIDGVNVKDIKLDSLHSQIGMVLQETFLFSGTIAENIAYAKPNSSMEEIISAAKRAYAHEFIMDLPDGYQTEIGQRGINLSGGEKQRISIARAILMNPPILILDEATASLDTQTEQKIQHAIDELVKGRTTVAIAHRLSTFKNAKRLIVVEDGCIVEEGTHKELFEKTDGHYFKMAKKQLEALRMYNLGGENVE